MRVEVKAFPADAGLLRKLAAELGRGTKRAAEVRSMLRRLLRPEKSLRQLLAIDVDIQDEAFDAAMRRPRGVTG